MNVQAVYPVDPMAVFYAAVSSVEEGKVGEVELEFRHETESGGDLVMLMTVRKEARPYAMFSPRENPEK